jgi:hypothetical protein
MKKNILLIILFGIYSASFAQMYTPPSADAMGLARCVNTPVSYYTGAPDITIPLGQVSGKELSVPVSLSYNATGVRVSDVASSVGLNWNLNAGGLITRVVRGLPDDLANGFCTSNFSDTEPDVYFFNFLGQSGKFILNKYGTPVIMPYRPLKIIPGICVNGSTGMWQIIDENGVTYKFGATTNERETISYGSTNYTSSWFLSEIDSPNGTEKIQITYLATQYSNINHYFTQTLNPCVNDVVQDLSTTLTINTKQVAMISAPLGSITFNWSSTRKDINGGYLLASMTISNATQQLSKYKFQYSYFQASGGTTPEYYRLRLDKIFDLAPDPIYSFIYNTAVNLPSRYTKNFDGWGYYNDNQIDSWIPLETNDDIPMLYEDVDNPAPPGFIVNFPGASRAPDEIKMQANALVSISERTGQTKQFFYEAHRYVDSHGTNALAGGLRIKSITIGDENGNSYTRNFKYTAEGNPNLTSGYNAGRPRYMVGFVDGSGKVYRYIIYSCTFNEVFDLGGVSTGYSRVEESVSGKGKTVYYYSNFDSNPNLYDANAGITTDMSFQRGNLTSVKSYDEQNNLLKNQILTYSFNEPTKLTINWNHIIPFYWSCSGNASDYHWTFQNLYLSRPIVLTKRTQETYDPGNSAKKIVSVADYTYDPSTYQCTTITQYDGNLSGVRYVTGVKYVSNSDYYLDCNASYSSCFSNCNNISDPQAQADCRNACQTQVNYCQNSTSLKAINLLRNRNQINAPVETYNIVQNGTTSTVVSSKVNVFQIDGASGTFVTLKEVWGTSQRIDNSSFSYSRLGSDGKLQFDSRMRKLKTFNTYDQQNANLLTKTNHDGVVQSYQWGYNNNSLITSVTTNPSNGNIHESYTYLPLVGKTSTTDVNGVASTTVYDVYNRVSMIKDSQGNIRKRYKYNYRNETPGFDLSASTAGTTTGYPVTFYLKEVTASVGGTPVFQWNFGDGTVINNGATTVTHAFSTANNYTVKVTGTNPEYPPAIRTVSVNIYNPLALSLCANGPYRLDYCGSVPTGYGSCTPAGTTSTTPSIILTATTTGGCPASYTYAWSYTFTPPGGTVGPWTPLPASNPTIPFSYSQLGNYQVRCTVTDACGNYVTTNYSNTITYFKSNCP